MGFAAVLLEPCGGVKAGVAVLGCAGVGACIGGGMGGAARRGAGGFLGGEAGGADVIAGGVGFGGLHAGEGGGEVGNGSVIGAHAGGLAAGLGYEGVLRGCADVWGHEGVVCGVLLGRGEI